MSALEIMFENALEIGRCMAEEGADEFAIWAELEDSFSRGMVESVLDVLENQEGFDLNPLSN